MNLTLDMFVPLVPALIIVIPAVISFFKGYLVSRDDSTFEDSITRSDYLVWVIGLFVSFAVGGDLLYRKLGLFWGIAGAGIYAATYVWAYRYICMDAWNLGKGLAQRRAREQLERHS